MSFGFNASRRCIQRGTSNNLEGRVVRFRREFLKWRQTLKEEKTMNTMIRKRTKVLAAMAVVLLAFLAVRLPQQTRAQLLDIAPPAPDRAFSAMAFALGQTARVNIAQIGDPNAFPAGAACGIIIN